MAKVDDTLPLKRTYVQEQLGQLVGIFQIDRKRLGNSVEARALPSSDGEVGLVAVANGGRLSETAFNVWTTGSQLFLEAGCPTSNRIDFNLSELARRLWGPGGKSASMRRRVADAIAEILRTRVVVVGVDPYTLKPAEGAEWEMQLLESAGADSEMKAVFRDARKGDHAAIAKLASLARSSDAKGTWSMVFPKWVADSSRAGKGVILDYDVQRTLRGSAKRIWVQLESYPGWRKHRLAPPTREQDLDGVVAALDGPGAVTVEPADDEAAIEIQTAAFGLTDDVYEAFGLAHLNRKRDLEAACRSILATDNTYLRAEVRPMARSKRRFELVVARAAGSLRQERLRVALRLRANQGSKEEPAADAA
jgi:hypothetical protein